MTADSFDIPLSVPHLGGRERKFIADALKRNFVGPLGPVVEAFEAELAAAVGAPKALAVASGTAAMHLALCLAGVGRGDLVLASSLTFIGSVGPAHHLGADLVFIDSEPATWNLDLDLLAEELAACARRGRLPKAVIPTELYGQPCDLERLTAICGEYGVPLVMDSAESLGSTCRGRQAGVGADFTVLSFNGNKIITSGGGGALIAREPGRLNEAQNLATQARDHSRPYYEHQRVGFNYRLSSLQAALGLGQLLVLKRRVEQRRKVFRYYQRHLAGVPGISLMPEAAFGQSNRWLSVILVEPEACGRDSAALREALARERIESRPLWKPMHVQPVFRDCRVVGGAVSEGLFARGLCLPSGSQLAGRPADLQRVVDVIRSLAGRG
ncbi:MAG: aminotransferase class I/II-fold pyridoxal phosphate-dependent enzyme [Thermodesulfobacteriota bacterium]